MYNLQQNKPIVNSSLCACFSHTYSYISTVITRASNAGGSVAYWWLGGLLVERWTSVS